MNRSWIPFRLILATLALLVIGTGCYEKMPRGGGDSGKGGSGKAGGGGLEKIFGLAIVDVITPSLEALLDPNCSGIATSLADLRHKEVQARQKAIATVVDSMSEAITITNDIMSAADCVSMGKVEERARHVHTSLPGTDNLKGKKTLHARVIIWFGDRNRETPSALVSGKEWASMQQLEKQGYKRRLSVNHVALTNVYSGYVYSWIRKADEFFNFPATIIERLEPTDLGLKKLEEAIAKSAQDFAAFLQAKAEGI
jgi:hypothetical protein